jgi:signal transduction histidine kinase
MIDYFLINKILLILVSVLGSWLIFLVYSNNKKSKMNRWFSLMIFFAIFWIILCYFSGINTKNLDFSLFLARLAYGVAILFLIPLYYFFSFFVSKKNSLFSLLVLIGSIIIAMFSILTDFMALHMVSAKIFGIDIGVVPVLNFGKYIWFIFALFVAIVVIVKIFKKYLISTASEKIQLQYFLLGTSIFLIATVIFNVILPFFVGDARYYQFGNYSVFFLIGLTAYAIIKRELFEIKVVLTTLLVGAIAILFTLDIFVFTTELMFQLYKGLILVIFLYFGILLVRSVLREIEMREKVKKAYDLEKKAREEIQQITEAKTQFIMATQHHLRTPLTSMIGYIDLLFGGTYGEVPPKIKNTLMKFQVSTRRLIRVVNALLDISQFQMGKQVVSLEKGVSFDSLITEVMEELQFEGKTRGLYLEYKPINKNLKIKADQEKLKVAMFNIIDNAIKYTKEGGITVSLKKNGSKAQLSVKDTGMGIEPEQAKKLFKEAFARGKDAKKAYGFGRGIGVYVTGHIIRAHKGSIWAESPGKGKGTTFFIELPIG